MSTQDEPPVGREDAEAVLAARQELGPAYEPALVDAFAERVEATIVQRVDARLAARDRELDAHHGSASRQTAIAILSLLAAVPIGIVLGLNGQLVALIVCWLGIAAVNAAHAAAVNGPGRRPHE